MISVEASDAKSAQSKCRHLCSSHLEAVWTQTWHYLLASLSVNCQMPTTKLPVMPEAHVQLGMAAWYSSGGSSDLTAASSLCLFRRHASLRSSSADSISLLPKKIALVAEGKYVNSSTQCKIACRLNNKGQVAAHAHHSKCFAHALTKMTMHAS